MNEKKTYKATNVLSMPYRSNNAGHKNSLPQPLFRHATAQESERTAPQAYKPKAHRKNKQRPFLPLRRKTHSRAAWRTAQKAPKAQRPESEKKRRSKRLNFFIFSPPKTGIQPRLQTQAEKQTLPFLHLFIFKKEQAEAPSVLQKSFYSNSKAPV